MFASETVKLLHRKTQVTETQEVLCLYARIGRDIYPVTEVTNCRNDFALYISACMTRRLCAHHLCLASACMTIPVCTPPLLRTGLDSVRSDDEQMTIKAKVSHGMECAQDVPLTLDVLRQLDLWDDVENCCRYGRRVVIRCRNSLTKN